MEELYKNLIDVLESFEEGELTYSDLGEWLRTNYKEIAKALKSNA